MLRISEQAEPQWFDIASGARILMRPADSVMVEAGRAASLKAAMAGEKAADVDHAFLVGCVVWGAIEWEGIAAEGSDELAPITEETVSPLLRQNLAVRDQLDRDYVVPMLLRESEKNASAPSPNGTSTAAQTIAPPPAGDGATSANMTNTGRKASKARGSGTSSGGAAVN